MNADVVLWVMWVVIAIADVFVIAHFIRSVRWKRDHAARR